MTVRGRFAPSPSGRMHLGNLMAALLAWLDVRSQGGTMVLRIEARSTRGTWRSVSAALCGLFSSFCACSHLLSASASSPA